MIQVGGSVQQLNVGEADAEQGGAQTQPESRRDAEAEQAEGGKMRVHPPARPGLQPAEAEVGEVVGRLDVERPNPAVGEVTDDCGKAQQTERDSERRKGRSVAGVVSLDCLANVGQC